MSSTELNRYSSGSDPLAPAGIANFPVTAGADRAAALDAHQHAPTLMGAMVPGTHGAVQVWGPDVRLARRRNVKLWTSSLVLSAASLAVMAYEIMSPTSGIGVSPSLWRWIGAQCIFDGACLILCLSGGWMLFDILRRRWKTGYVSIDNAGISFSLKTESADEGITNNWKDEARALAWDDIAAMSVGLASIMLYTRAGVRLSGWLWDYSRAGVDEMVAAICQHAGLQPSTQLTPDKEALQKAADVINQQPLERKEKTFKGAYGKMAPCLLFFSGRVSHKDIGRMQRLRARFTRFDCRPEYQYRPFLGLVPSSAALESNPPAALTAPDPGSGADRL